MLVQKVLPYCCIMAVRLHSWFIIRSLASTMAWRAAESIDLQLLYCVIHFWKQELESKRSSISCDGHWCEMKPYSPYLFYNHHPVSSPRCSHFVSGPTNMLYVIYRLENIRYEFGVKIQLDVAVKINSAAYYVLSWACYLRFHEIWQILYKLCCGQTILSEWWWSI